jgi:preprotein translocase subunit SecA
MEWMGPTYLGLGLTVGAIQAQMRPNQRQPQYGCDITYGTNNEFGFDYLRDNMKMRVQDQVQGPLDYAIVDEIDNILIDEARTPLIISGPAQDDITRYPKADRIARLLQKGEHFEVKEKEHTCNLTDEGVRKAEELAEVETFYTAGNMEWPHLIDNALKAHHLYKRDVNYVVENGEVVIVDEHTGRKMYGRQWSDGLHQAVEAKEGVRVKETTQTLATITLQNYFKLYKKLCGMTGTAMTEANEFNKIYKLDVIEVPTNRPMSRINHPDVIFRSEREKWNAVLEEVREVHKTGRPVLVGTVSIEKSERLATMLDRNGIRHNVLNAKFHEREAEIIAQAGRYGAVTVSTNMAGRGTDIILGGNPEHMAWEDLKATYQSRLEVPKAVWDAKSNEIAEREGMKAEGRKVAELGGLHVVGTERHDARRIDLQLRGRSGRQGDPGSSRFFLSLEDDLMRIFAGDLVQRVLSWLGMQEGEAIESRMVTKQIERAQKRVEERHFESRKNLLEYDEVMDHQRKAVYSYRQSILEGVNCRDLILQMIDRQIARIAARPEPGRVQDIIEEEQFDKFRHFMHPMFRWDMCAAFARKGVGISVEPDALQDMDQKQMADFLLGEAERQAEDVILQQMDENLPEDGEERDWNWQALTSWANRHYNINLSLSDVKKQGRGNPDVSLDRTELHRYLVTHAKEALQRLDFTPLDRFLEPAYPQRVLCDWLKAQFSLEMSPEQFMNLDDPDEACDLIRRAAADRYREQEARFPVAIGLNRYLPKQGNADRTGLITWANARFSAHLNEDDFKEKGVADIEKLLLDRSRAFLPGSEVFEPVDEYLDRGWNGSSNGSSNGGAHPAQADELAAYANKTFHCALDSNQLATLDRDNARQAVLKCYDEHYRPELGRAERTLLLDRLDHAWKEHLYQMDHLRQGIGFEAYAQKDPKVEYKRQGMKAFEEMWDRVGREVTHMIFRLEREGSPEFLNSLWAGGKAAHQQAQSAAQEAREQMTNRPEPGQEGKAIDPIVNEQPKVGRNDPCPCGSGKKFKKCHGA